MTNLEPVKPDRGRPPKRAKSLQIAGNMLRIPLELRNRLRRCAEDASDDAGRVISNHDIIVQFIEEGLKWRGY